MYGLTLLSKLKIRQCFFLCHTFPTVVLFNWVLSHVLVSWVNLNWCGMPDLTCRYIFPLGFGYSIFKWLCHPSISAFRNLFLGLVGGQKKFRIELGLHVESNFLNSGFPSCLVLSLSGYLLSLTPKSITFSSCLDDRWMTKSLVHTWNCCSNKILDIGYRFVLCDLSCDECSKYTTVCPSSNR